MENLNKIGTLECKKQSYRFKTECECTYTAVGRGHLNCLKHLVLIKHRPLRPGTLHIAALDSDLNVLPFLCSQRCPCDQDYLMDIVRLQHWHFIYFLLILGTFDYDARSFVKDSILASAVKKSADMYDDP